jgi:hypothetical protein
MPIRSKISQHPRDKSKRRHNGTIIITSIPRDTKYAFKSACCRRGQTMRDAFILFMRQYAKDTPGIVANANYLANRVWEGKQRIYGKKMATTQEVI